MLTRNLLIPSALLFFTLTLSSCASTSSEPWVEVKGQRYTVEIADDEASRMRGLMFRDHMPLDHGMLFVFDQEEMLAFWMKNTRIPLDIMYFDNALRLVSVSTAPPCNTQACPSYPSKGKARFVLELNAGQSKQLGISVGDTLTLEPALLTKINSPPK